MEKTICLFGDSITWGAWDPEKGGWGTRLRSFFETNDYEVVLYNCGVCNDTTSSLLKRLVVECSARRPDIIVFSIGINDARYINTIGKPEITLDKFEQNYIALLELANKYTDKIVCLGLANIDESRTMPCSWDTEKFYSKENVQRYDARIREICQNNSTEYLPIIDLLGAGDLDDGLHPNSKGHEKMFERIKELLISSKFALIK